MTRERGLQLIDRLASEGRTAFRAADVQESMGLSRQASSNLLRRLVEAGLLDRIAPGRYAIRQIGTLGTAAAWDDLGSAVAAVFGGHPHRIGYLTALDHHGLLVRPVRPVQAASSYRPRAESLSGRPFRVVYEGPRTVLLGTEPLGPSRVATVERALLDTASKPKLSGGVWRLAEALTAVRRVSGLRELAQEIGALSGYRRIGSIASTLSLSIASDWAPPQWSSLIELDRQSRGDKGWVDMRWGVAWPYPATDLEAAVAA